MNTPWGPSQTIDTVADGIQFVSTARHGGFLLSAERHAEVQRRFPFRTFAGGQWYEEDCDAVVPVLAFPGEFDDVAVRRAVGTARTLHRLTVENPEQHPERGWTWIVAWLAGPDLKAAAIRDRVAAFEAANADRWERGSMWSPANGYPSTAWGVSLTRVGDGARRTVVFADYPAQQFYTDKELEALAATPARGEAS